ncbi:hypothetical protein [Prochlorococcus marinus]|uniref:hypothetical protein n=1 Tax=Prochlorococcus marinus TaxID=1219 RepID=UPI001ADAC525|nr:hypothetical protein [Prochlorococcus marinus]MBO8217682.1 hypothetical protein [Prochlorococcus marinus XMU1405]MBW3040845.1 hypothetical protein [Prochlorococcus marinus str. MU1405]MBW3048304.1 hypothetical protein [Prochlorococcus marinus str. MU1406]
MTIFGNGYVANLLKNSSINFSFDIYAKGISNSVDASQKEYKRDIKLLEELIKKQDQLFYYISSSDLSNKKHDKTDYLKHKKNCESLVLSTPYARVIRISQIVGNLNSETALLNYFKNKILLKSKINIHYGKIRYPISSEDVIKGFEILNEIGDKARIIDFRPKFGIKAENIINLMMQELKISTDIEYSFFNSNEEEWEINILNLYNHFPKLDDEFYCKKIIKNYIKQN